MKAHPILMSGDMVRALLAGAKTQTRRVVKLNASGRASLAGRNWHLDDPDCVKACPYGSPGDLLWVRETWAGAAKRPIHGAPATYFYRADGERQVGKQLSALSWVEREKRWRSPVAMPRWASRLTLRITEVRVQRVQEISEDDARAEGTPGPFDDLFTPRRRFESLWDSIYGHESWDANPWVWALTFDVIRKNVDEVAA